MYLAVWVWADAAHCRQLGSIPRTTEPTGVWAAGGWFTCKNNRCVRLEKLHQEKLWSPFIKSPNFTRVLSELHHSLHRLWVCQSHEPEKLGPPTAFMEIHLYGFLLLFEHLKAAMKWRLNTISPGKNPIMLIKWNVCRPTLTCLWWERVRRCRWRKRSQSVQRLPHMLHRMMAAVSPSSWLSHMGCGEKRRKYMYFFLFILLNIRLFF